MSRGGYWLLILILGIASVVALMADLALAVMDARAHKWLLTGILSIASLWPDLAVSVKRAHDRNRSGWFLLIVLIPLLGVLWLFIELACLAGTNGPNRFGPDPRAASAQ